MFHPKHILIQYELQKYRLVYQSDFHLIIIIIIIIIIIVLLTFRCCYGQ